MPKKEWPPKEEFADRFARLRRHKKLDNAEIAKATGVIPKTVSMWAGGQEPKGAALLALARLLDVSPEYLLTGQEAGEHSRQKAPKDPHFEKLEPTPAGKRKRGQSGS